MDERKTPLALTGGLESEAVVFTQSDLDSVYQIDWLGVTLPFGTRLARPPQCDTSWVEGTPHRGYRDGVHYSDGCIVSSHPEYPERGVHVSWSGSALENVRRQGITDADLINFYRQVGGKVTRIDLAIDVHNAGVSVQDVVDAYREGHALTLTRTCEEFKSLSGGGHTLYFGHKSSDKRLRIYDKAAEQKIDGDWIRVELQLRREKAMNAFELVGSSPDEAGKIFGRLISSFVFWALGTRIGQWWQRVTSPNPLEFPPATTKTERQRKRWLKTSVWRAVARMIVEEGITAWSWFESGVMSEYDHLVGQINTGPPPYAIQTD